MPVPLRPNQRWSLDFLSDTFGACRRFRILAVNDDCCRENLALADTSISGARVARGLDALVRIYGKPACIVSDNGTEFTSKAILKWANANGVEWHYIDPGKPQQNGYIESFMYRRPRGRKCFERDLHRRVRSCIRPVRAALYMTAGPDGVRGSRPHQRDALWRA